ncbi:putative nuclease HARBI1 [Penaeus japonicus]|uniref:putative nuclease HARBI1 n=1 Tax=Penaeus japonicus TaxID=27405 RepID=UPI001C713876|nr:putative nuclease HARBI1 [Penaeus japonicus]
MDHLEHLDHIEHLANIDERVAQHIVPNRMNPYQVYSEAEFAAKYRLSKECSLQVLEFIQDHLPVVENSRGHPIPPHLQLLLTLRYLATGNFQMTLGDGIGVSQPTVSRCTANISKIIAQLAPRHIKFPEPQAEDAVIRQFAEIAGMPGVIGCIDGTHIPIRSPGGDNAELYRCQKGYFSLNVMGVCDANLKFTNVVVNWAGSAHDARIFNESLLCERLKTVSYKGYLLGDSAYPCRSYILTPILNPKPGKQSNYNSAHVRTRNLIERAFGILKRRWAVLSKPVRTKLETTKDIIMACAVLHNIAVSHGLTLDLPEDFQLDPPENPDLRPQNVQEDTNRRMFVIKNFF